MSTNYHSHADLTPSQLKMQKPKTEKLDEQIVLEAKMEFQKYPGKSK